MTLKIGPTQITYISDDNEHREEPVDCDELIAYLGDWVDLVDGITLRQFFDYLRPAKNVLGIIFAKQLGFHNLDKFFEDMETEREDSKKDDMDYLVISWNAKAWPAGKGYDKGLLIDAEFLGEQGGQSYAIEFSPLFEIADTSLRLDTAVVLKLKHSVKNVEILLETKKTFTLWDVIGAILFEISFVGEPEERDDYALDLQGRAILSEIMQEETFDDIVDGFGEDILEDSG
jgi:hypothetical protein